MGIFHKCIYGPVDSKGYQYCKVCNKAKLIGLPKCIHNWDTIEKIGHSTVYNRNGYYKFTYIQQCTECGELNKFDTQSN